jgi:uncharacterized protein (TIGR03118 family)
MNFRNLIRGGLPALVLAFGTNGFVIPAGAQARPENEYVVHNLVSDGTIPADHVDTNLVNAWGLSRSATSPWWVADNGTNLSTLYNGSGMPQSLVVHVPGAPTGTVYNGGPSFVVTNDVVSAPARFLFATEAGTILGWSSAVDATTAEPALDRSSVGAIYKGLAIATTTSGDFLYAADFHNNRVDMIDGTFTIVTPDGAFVDPHLPQGYAPFGIQNLQGRIYVAYAKQDENAVDEVHGPGRGIVSVFDTQGRFIARVVNRGFLNAPWGMAIAPAGFGRFSGDLLVGNFGNGRINAFDLATGGLRGTLRLPDHRPVEIDGLWGIGFGNGAGAGPTNTLFFAAGPDDESHGLFGTITAEE